MIGYHLKLTLSQTLGCLQLRKSVTRNHSKPASNLSLKNSFTTLEVHQHTFSTV